MAMSTDRNGSLPEPRRGNHQALLEALLNPTCYPHPVGQVEQLETPMSDVFLTGKYAYKIKKPLGLQFPDFSTLEKRRRFCEEELRLNRRLASELYLGVVPITGELAHPRVGGEGVPIEYAIQMRQFDQAGLLDRVVPRGDLSSAQVDEIGEIIAAFHLALPPASPDSPYGYAETIMQRARENLDPLLLLTRSEAERNALEWLRQWTLAQHARHRPLFEERRRDGFVRECHGDLHLGNMVLTDARIRIFDCIEFNAHLRWIDVINEAAFLAMDLIFHQRSDLAHRFLDRYLQVTGDYSGVRLLRYYMVHTSLMRARVAAMRAAHAGLDQQAADVLRERCRTQVMLARELAESARPVLAILHGFSGSGKTAVSQIVLQTIGAIRLRSHVEHKRLHSMTRVARSQSGVGQSNHPDQAGSLTYNRLAQLAGDVLDGGFPVLVDAAFLQRSHREQLRGLAQAKGVPFAILHTAASEATLRHRLAQRAMKAVDPAEASGVVLDRQLANAEPLTEAEKDLSHRFDTENADPHAVGIEARQLFRGLLGLEPCSAPGAESQAAGLMPVK
jgi:aminoglycoside phosphotransferase family enzyme/predicted kinase